MALRWIKKRDGRRVRFEAEKLADSISEAAREAGEPHGVPAGELALVVAHFLEKHFTDRIPEVSDLRDLVEKLLLDTGHPRVAAAFVAGRERRDRLREELVVVRSEDDGLGFAEGPGAGAGSGPGSASGEAGDPWAKGRIVVALERRGLETALADEIAAAVEAKVFALGVRRVTAGVVRELVDLEVAGRRLAQRFRLGRPGEVVVRTDEIRRRLLEDGAAATPEGAEGGAGADVLARLALAEVYPPDAAEAHRAGEIHIAGLGRPLRLVAGAIDLEAVKVQGGRSVATAGDLGAALAGAVLRAAARHGRAVAVPWADVLLAPFVRKKEPAARREVREMLRALAAAAGGVAPAVFLHVAGATPPELAGRPAIGPGARTWHATYGELGPEVERAARLLLEAPDADGLAPAAPARVVSVAAGEAPPAPVAAALDALAAHVLVQGPGLAPPLARGLAPPAPAPASRRASAAGSEPAPAVHAGCAALVALNVARAAYRAGSGPDALAAFERELEGALGMALDAFKARADDLLAHVWRPPLPLWEPAAPAVRPDPFATPAARAVYGLALVGWVEAARALAGDAAGSDAVPGAEEAVAAVLLRLARRAVAEGGRRGLAVAVCDADLGLARRRLADLDLARFRAARTVVRAGPGGAHDFAYGAGLLATAPAAEAARAARLLARPLGLAPFVARGPELRGRVEAVVAAVAAVAAG